MNKIYSQTTLSDRPIRHLPLSQTRPSSHAAVDVLQMASGNRSPADANQLVISNRGESLLSGKAVARLFDVTPQTMAQWRYNRRVVIPFVRIGGRVMYRKSDVEAFISANTHGRLANGSGASHA